MLDSASAPTDEFTEDVVASDDRSAVMELEGLEQRLKDPERPEEFVVYVKPRITIKQGDFVALLGPSGCGKTTLLTVLGLLRAPTNPKLIKHFAIYDQAPSGTKEIDLAEAWHARRFGLIERLRRKQIGFALQSGELLPALTVSENIAAPLNLNGIRGARCHSRVRELIDAFGLRRKADAPVHGHPDANTKLERDYDLSTARANKLSGGEYQRVSLARAIAHCPSIVFVDEPTSALNRELARGALQQFKMLQATESARSATVMITHDEELAGEFANVTIRMEPMRGRPAGEVVEVIRRPLPVASAEAGASGR